MTKVELVAKIAEAAGLTKVQAEKALNGFIDATTAAIKAGDKVTVNWTDNKGDKRTDEATVS